MSRFPLLLSLLPVVLLASCTHDPPVAPPVVVIPGESDPIVYTRHIQPIFQTSCASSGCHMAGDRAGGLSLVSWENVMEGSSTYGAEAIPFSSSKSHLFQHVNTDSTISPLAFPRMPLGRNPLPIEQIRLIRRWLDEGARNDLGEVALGDPKRPRVFVTGQSEDVVTVVDLETERTVRYLSVGSRSSGNPEAPHNITLSPDGRFFYCNLIAAGTIEKYDAGTFEKLGTTSVGSSPAQISISSDGSRLFVSNFDLTLRQRFIVTVDAATMTVIDTIHDVGNAPHGVVVSPDEQYLYTTNALGDDISVVDIATREVVRRIPVSPGDPLPPGNKARFEPYQGIFTNNGNYFWFTCRASAEVRVLDVAAGRVVDSIPVGNRPLIPAVTFDGGEIWVPNQVDNTISIVNVASRSVVFTISGVASQPHAIAFVRNRQRAFISCENQNGSQHHPTAGSSLVPGRLLVVDVPSRSIRRTIEVGAFAAGIVVTE